MADGGEGTPDAALANGYERREAVVHGPLGAPLRASFAIRGDEAVVELAVAWAATRPAWAPVVPRWNTATSSAISPRPTTAPAP
jgi:glycerate kinase